MISAIGRWWRKRQRQIDIDILWPLLRDCAQSREHAEQTFILHCALDPSWNKDFDEWQISNIVKRLK